MSEDEILSDLYKTFLDNYDYILGAVYRQYETHFAKDIRESLEAVRELIEEGFEE